MNPKPPPNDDAPLNALLKAWKPNASLPPSFQDQVWRRIDLTEHSSPLEPGLIQHALSWLAAQLPRPAYATAYLALLLAMGAGLGWNQAQKQTTRVTTELGSRYAQSVDPYSSAIP